MSEEPGGRSIAADVRVRTLWHSLYDQHRGTAEVSFTSATSPTPATSAASTAAST